MKHNASRARAALLALTSVFLFLAACSVPFKGGGPASGEMDPNRTNEDIKEGPGLLTGEEGGFVFRRGYGDDRPSTAPTAPTQVQTERLDQQTREFDRQIEELERQRRELEQLKEELREILRNNPRPQ